MLDLEHYPQVVEVLDFIFENPEMRLPTIEELLLCDLFRNIDLREIRNQAQSTVSESPEELQNGKPLRNNFLSSPAAPPQPACHFVEPPFAPGDASRSAANLPFSVS